MNTRKRIVTRPTFFAQSRARTSIFGIGLVSAGVFVAQVLDTPQLATAAGTDPASRADDLLAQVEQRAGEADITEIVKKARQLINDARADGVKPEVAQVYGDAALEWAGVASDWLNALAKEADADAREAAVGEAQTELKHARALLEETEARRNRAEGLLRQMNNGPRPTGPQTTEPRATPDTTTAAPANPTEGK